MSLGENIKKYRKAKKISREELGKKIGLSQYSVKKYEIGKVTPSIETLKKIAKVFEVSLNDLIDTDQVTRTSFKENFDLNIFDTKVMKYINDLKNNMNKLFPEIKFDNTLIIQNLIIDIMANKDAETSSGMSRRSLLYQFPVVDNKILTGEELYKNLFDMYFKKYNQEYKNGLETKSKMIIHAYTGRFDELDDRGISILSQYYKDTSNEDIPEEILKILPKKNNNQTS